MKIAILTLPLHANYGGILQCYALQTVLEGMGHQVTVLNRRWPGPNARLVARRFASIAKCIVKKYLLGHKDIALMSPWADDYNIHKPSEAEKKRHTEIRRFIKEYIHLTKPLRSSDELREYVEANEVDCIVVGSDQVWREIYGPCIEDYFLGFLPEGDKRVKVTYAASFGTADSPISEDHLKKCIPLAKRFSSISVREQSGMKVMKDIFGLDAKLHLDPTLLLSAEQYKFPVKDVEKGCLVSYILDETEDKIAISQEVSKELHFKNKKLRLDATSQDDVVLPSIEDWLSSFANAEFVVTDSFHGCVFSIINHKPFIAIANKDRGLERFTSLLGTFGQMDRLIFDYQDFISKIALLLRSIDYTTVNNKLQEIKQESVDYLENHL